MPLGTSLWFLTMKTILVNIKSCFLTEIITLSDDCYFDANFMKFIKKLCEKLRDLVYMWKKYIFMHPRAGCV